MRRVGPKGDLDRRYVEEWQQVHEARTGRRVDMRIHRKDEMLAFIRSIDDDAPFAHYLDSGGAAVDALADALGHAPEGPLLDFACGYGRVTRHLVARLDPGGVTVSEIDRRALAFVRSTFGVDGFASVADPADLDHAGRYRTIWVASLFTHLSLRRWQPWMAALVGLLADDGVLVASTNAVDRHGLPEVEPGFCFGTGNETNGRLDASDYGTTDVSAEWVEGTVAAAGGRLVRSLPLRLWASQDLNVITRA